MSGQRRPPAIAIGGTIAASALAVIGLVTGQHDLMWIGWIALFGAMEGNAIINETEGDTLSERTRVWFATKSRAGRWGFLASLGVGAAWYAVHIIAPGVSL